MSRSQSTPISSQIIGMENVIAKLEQERDELAAQNQALRDSLVDTLYFLERNSNRWDGINGKHPFNIVESARAALALPGHAASILRQRDARTLRMSAQVCREMTLYTGLDCADALNARADELEKQHG